MYGIDNWTVDWIKVSQNEVVGTWTVSEKWFYINSQEICYLMWSAWTGQWKNLTYFMFLGFGSKGIGDLKFIKVAVKYEGLAVVSKQFMLFIIFTIAEVPHNAVCAGMGIVNL